MTVEYTASAVITLSGAAHTVFAALINPANSGKIVRVRIVLPAPIATLGYPPATKVERYNVVITAVETNAANIPTIYRSTSSGPAPVALLYTRDSHTFTKPNVSEKNFEVLLPLIVAIQDNEPIDILPGQTGVLEAVEDGGGVPVTFLAQWVEVLERATHIASGPLPASGAYDTPSYYALSEDVKKVTFWPTYTVGAAGGYAVHQIEWENGTESGAPEPVLGSTVTITGNVATQVLYRREFEGPRPSDGNPLAYPPITVTKHARATGVRFRSAEKGVTLTPGTFGCGITVE